MRLTILGATGGIGRLLLPLALEQGHEVTALARAPEKITATGERLRVFGGNLLNTNEIASAIKGSDAVFSAFGPTTLRRPYLRRDFGRVLVEAMRATGVTRVIHVTTAFLFGEGAHLLRHVEDALPERHRRSSGERAGDHPTRSCVDTAPSSAPSRCQADRSSASSRESLAKRGFTISRADVASFMLQEAITPRYVQQVVGISN